MEQTKPLVNTSMRFIQICCIILVVVGFIWASSDYLLAIMLDKAPVTPLSLLFMLYGLIGILATETTIRIFNRRKSFLQQPQSDKQQNG